MLSSSFVINSIGEIKVNNEILAKSGYAIDIQSAVDNMSGSGGIVRVPAGTFEWSASDCVSIPGGVSVLGASPAGCQGHEDNWVSNSATTILHKPAATASGSDSFFYLSGNTIRISGIRFECSAVTGGNDDLISTGVVADGTTNIRIDHCSFVNFVNVAFLLRNTGTGTASAVVDHCTIDNPYKLSGSGWMWGYGFYVQGAYPNWDSDITKFLGKFPVPAGFPVLYVEDCHMTRCRHAVDAIQGGWIVARYSYIDHPYPVNFGQLNIHGSGGGGWTSGRGFEYYNNLVVCESSNSGQPAWLRGGGGVVFNNVFRNVYQGIGLYNEDGIAGTTLSRCYIWNNTIDGGTLINNAGGYTENVDYFLRAPTQIQDGFTYTPYQYPHPLTSTLS